MHDTKRVNTERDEIRLQAQSKGAIVATILQQQCVRYVNRVCDGQEYVTFVTIENIVCPTKRQLARPWP